MSLKAKGYIENDNEELRKDPIEAGSYIAQCVHIFDLGTQQVQVYNKPGEFELKQRISFVFELIDYHNPQTEEKEPRCISTELTNSLHEKASLRKALESWRGINFTKEEVEQGFDVSTMLGEMVRLNIVNQISKNDRKYAKINGFSKLRQKEIDSLQFEFKNPLIFYCMEEHGFNIPEGTPDFVKKQIEQSEEFKNRK